MSIPLIYSPHIYGLKSNSLDLVFAPLSFRSSVSAFEGEVYFLNTNKSRMFRMPGLNQINCEGWTPKGLDIFEKNYIHLSTNHEDFEKFCFSRFFYIRQFMQERNLNEAFLIETDVLLFADLANFLDRFNRTEKKAVLTESKCISLGYVTFEYIDYYCEFVNTVYNSSEMRNKLSTSHRNYIEKGGKGGVCDMVFCDFINNGQYGADQLYKSSDFSMLTVNSSGDDECFDSFIGRLKHTSSKSLKFTKANSYVDNKVIKDISFSNGSCYAKSNEGLVRMLSLHCQGSAKSLMGDFYVNYLSSSN